MTLWRSRKALSPVVAAIILIAVAVATSIAVSTWLQSCISSSNHLKVRRPSHDWEGRLRVVNKGIYAWMVNDLGLVRAGAEEFTYTGLATIRVFNSEGMVVSKAELYVEPQTNLTVFLWQNGTITTKAEHIE